jgi:hypothetical protein
MLRGQRDLPPARSVRVPLHHGPQAVVGELHIGVKGRRDIPAMDTDLGNEVVENGPNGLGTVWSVTQFLPVVGSHLREGVLERPDGCNKF